MTPELLRAATGCTQDAADLYAEHLDAACTYYEITDQRLAMFLAQIAHESGSLRHVAELSTGEAYEGRNDLGNTRPGDGPRFKGRGLIQCTGRANYRRMTTWLDRLGCPDFETAPESLTAPRWAAWSAAAWWYHNGCNALADAGDYVGVGRLINRGNAKSVKPAIGEPDRLARYEAAKAAFQVRPAPAPQPRTDYEGAPAPQESTMAPLIPALVGPLVGELAGLIPRVASLWKGKSEVAERNVALGTAILETVTKAVGAANAQEAVEKVAADPESARKAREAVDAQWAKLDDMREASLDKARGMYHSADRIVALNMVFHEVLALLIIVLCAAGMVGAFAYGELSQSTKDNIVMLALVGGFIGVKEFFFGGSRGSDIKTAMLGKERQ